MRLSNLPNLRAEDFPDETSFPKLFVQLNPFFQSVNQLLDQNVEFGTNIKSVTKEYTVTAFQPFDFQWSFSEAAPRKVEVISASKGASQTPTILLLAWSYNASSRAISVTRLVEVTDTGIQALSGSYKFTIRATV